jgi:PTS system cellobiose-specific IIC component
MEVNMNKLAKTLGVISYKCGNEVHLRSLRDGFAMLFPFIIIAGFIILINNVIIGADGILKNILSADVLTKLQSIGAPITNGTLNIITLLGGTSIAYYLAKNKKFENPLSAGLLTLSILVILMPSIVSIVPVGMEQAVDVQKVIPFTHTSSTGLFVGIVIGLLGTELFMWLSKNKTLKINITGDGIPPAVNQSFNLLIPSMLTILVFSLASFLLKELFKVDFYQSIGVLLQEPLSMLISSVPGFLFLSFLSQLFYSFGIAGSAVVIPVMKPVLLANMQENMDAFANHETIPHIINQSFFDVFGVMGGGGNTIALLIVIFLFSKNKGYREVSKLSLLPGVFNINEPMVFGMPIVFNVFLMIPFIIATPLCHLLAYIATAMGIINPVVVQLPFTTPVVLSGFLATGGDWRAGAFQIFLIFVVCLLYYVFLKAEEKSRQLTVE